MAPVSADQSLRALIEREEPTFVGATSAKYVGHRYVTTVRGSLLGRRTVALSKFVVGREVNRTQVS